MILQWSRSDLNAALDGIFEAIRQSAVGTTRRRNLHDLFHKLGEAALTEQPFQIDVDPSQRRQPRELRDDDFQRIVDYVRERRQQQRAG